jgi:hypothetical protein
MRSVKIVIMVPALSDTSRPNIFQSYSINRVPQNPSKKTSNLPSAEEIASLAIDPNNSIVSVLTEIVNKHNISGFDNTPASLEEAFNMLSKVSNVISKLSESERLAVKVDLQNAFHAFYSENMNLPDAVSAKEAKKVANALTNGSSALERLKKAVNKFPQAVKFGENVLAILNSQDSNKPTIARQSSGSGRKKFVQTLHTSNPV